MTYNTPTDREAVEQTIADMEKIGHTEPTNLLRALADERDAAVARAEAAEDEVERLREAVRGILACPNIADRDPCPWSEPETEQAVKEARAALGEGGE